MGDIKFSNYILYPPFQADSRVATREKNLSYLEPQILPHCLLVRIIANPLKLTYIRRRCDSAFR